MSTLTIGNIKWNIAHYESKSAYTFGNSHAILFDPASKAYVLMARGNVVYRAKHASECLEVATGVILDDCVSKYVPSWEN
jgi:hypothetical protein